MYNKFWTFLFLAITVLTIQCCKDDGPDVEPQGRDPHTPVPYEIEIPPAFAAQQVYLNPDNPMTEEGILLGRHLFYDPILSGDSTMSCATCHKQEFAFGSDKPVEAGIHGDEGTRNAMPLFNMIFWDKFSWDGLQSTLEQQHLVPVTNPIEMAADWTIVEQRIAEQPTYIDMYWEAFNDTIVTKELTTKAIAQFIRSITAFESDWELASSGDPSVFLPDEALDGHALYLDHIKSSCLHCHAVPGNLTDFEFRNNGLDGPDDIYGFEDPGLGGVTGNPTDYGKFKTPSLINIEVTGPYMHDGRFETLEEVLEFYNEHVQESPNLDPSAETDFIEQGGGVFLSEEETANLIAFLKAQTDHRMLTNPAYGNPFEE